MLDIFYSSQFKKDYKRMKKQGKSVELLLDVVEILAGEGALDPKYQDHALAGGYIGHRECHVQPDWLLIYKIDGGQLLLTLTRTGTHSELFRK